MILNGNKVWNDSQCLQWKSKTNLEIVGFHLHYIDAILNESDTTTLRMLLDDGSLEQSTLTLVEKSLLNCLENGLTGWKMALVVPRPGTISPWSSKATDIARICGLDVKRIERAQVYFVKTNDSIEHLFPLLHDRMTQVVYESLVSVDTLFAQGKPQPLVTISLESGEKQAFEILNKVNVSFGLALSKDEVEYLAHAFASDPSKIHSPTDAEIMMFSQINSEHCRHKIFNATWDLDSTSKELSLFKMIKKTYDAQRDTGILSAYHDNAAVFASPEGSRFGYDSLTHAYGMTKELMHTLIKVETHNHPTAVSPFPGASTGSGGEIRDEGAVGRGSKSKAGLSGFTVSHLSIPGNLNPWEAKLPGKPDRIASPLDIMIEAPLGAAAFNNEFGRPCLTGYFRTFLTEFNGWQGFHKPIMIAGGLGTVRPMHVLKLPIPVGSPIIVLGGPSMLIGLGGGAASSMTSGSSSAELDFASVQRDNPEMERRAQMVIDGCTNLGHDNPIISIHDVGAGGLSNAIPELVHDCGVGALIQLRDIPCDDASMSPMQIWCNESQERYVLGVSKSSLALFEKIAKRERCPFAVVGVTTLDQKLVIQDSLFGNCPVDLELGVLFGKAPRTHLIDTTVVPFTTPLSFHERPLTEMIDRLMAFPSIASKSFLITIGDRYVTGAVARDQMVGPWQVPVADVGVVLASMESNEYNGQAMAMGERPPLALLSPEASVRMAIAESLTNLAASDATELNQITLSANWMAAPKNPGQGSALYRGVNAAMDLSRSLGVVIPVGKDSLSMKTVWNDGKDSVSSPLSLVVTAYSNVNDVRLTLTPQLQRVDEESVLVLIDLAKGQKRLGVSCLAQVYSEVGESVPDVESVDVFKAFWKLMSVAKQNGLFLAYHDRSDGGLFTTIAEMCFAGHLGCRIDLATYLDSSDRNGVNSALFNEELGCVVQIRKSALSLLTQLASFSEFPLGSLHIVGSVTSEQTLSIAVGQEIVWSESRVSLQRKWAHTSFLIQSRRDDPVLAQAEYDSLLNESDRGLHLSLTFDPNVNPVEQLIKSPSANLIVAVLREQGVNSHIEMAYAFYHAGFDVLDVHMTDLISGSVSLDKVSGLACPGGFSYGDVLGAGAGWAKSILMNSNASSALKRFFHRLDTFTIGICNGCQMLTTLASFDHELIPGSDGWPRFRQNLSTRFEARMALVQVTGQNESLFFKGMEGSILPIAVAHGEGRVEGSTTKGVLRFVKYDESVAESGEYPFNPNGSVGGLTAVTSTDGRVLAMMPHPERIVRGITNTWQGTLDSDRYGSDSGWMRVFYNARLWISSHHQCTFGLF